MIGDDDQDDDNDQSSLPHAKLKYIYILLFISLVFSLRHLPINIDPID
jgi:hypothetical protein